MARAGRTSTCRSLPALVAPRAASSSASRGCTVSLGSVAPPTSHEIWNPSPLSLSALAAEAHSALVKRSEPTASSAKLPPRIR